MFLLCIHAVIFIFKHTTRNFIKEINIDPSIKSRLLGTRLAVSLKTPSSWILEFLNVGSAKDGVGRQKLILPRSSKPSGL